MTTINPGEPTSIGNWRTAVDRSDGPADLRSRLLPGGDSPPPSGGGQPQILSVVNLNGNAEITVDMPSVPGADRFEWWAGSNNDHWSTGSQESPNISFTSPVVFQAPRQENINDNSFFCYRGANSFGPAPNNNCNGFVIQGVESEPDPLGAPTIDSASATSDGESVVLTVSPGANAENHDVHRILGDTNFTASGTNRIATNIGPTPASYGDLSVSPDNIYSYRLTSKRTGFSSVQSNRVAVSTGVLEPGPGGGPNEPDGYGVWAHHNCLTLPDGALSNVGRAGADYGQNYSIISDPSSPNGAAIRIRYPQGHILGASPGRFFVWDQGTTCSSTRLREWYIHYWYMFEANPADGRFEAAQNETKMVYGITGGAAAPNISGTLTANQAGPHGTLTTQFAWKWTSRFSSCVTQPNQVAPLGAIQVGQWHRFEMKGEWGSPNTTDAFFRFWLDGQLVHEQFTRNHLPSCIVTETCGVNNRTVPFHEFHWAPVWGGAGSHPPKVRTDFTRLGHIYVSGIPF